MDRRTCLTFAVGCFVSLVNWIEPIVYAQSSRSPVTFAIQDSDGQTIIFGSQRSFSRMSWNGAVTQSMKSPNLSHIHDAIVCRRTSRLFLVGGEPASSGMMEIYDKSNLQFLSSHRVHEDVIYSVAISSDQSLIATASADRTCCVVDVDTLKIMNKYSGHSKPVNSIQFLDLQKVVSGSADHCIQVWDSTTGKQVRNLDNHLAPIAQLAVCSDTFPSILYSCSSDKTVRQWQPQIGRLVRFCRIAEPVTAMALGSCDFVVVGTKDGSIHWLESNTMQVVKSKKLDIGTVYVIVANPEGKRMFVGGSGGWEFIEI